MSTFLLEAASPDEQGQPFRDWLSRQLVGKRRKTERLLAFIQQWDHLDGPEPRSVRAYAERWNVSEATAYRLLEEFRSVFPGEVDPDRLLDVLWRGAKEYSAKNGLFAALIDVPVKRSLEPGIRDLRDLLPIITKGTLGAPLYGNGRLVVAEGDPYEAYEYEGDRFAWSPVHAADGVEFLSYILEDDADDFWMPAPGQPEFHADRADAELKSGLRWANAQGYRLVGVGIKVPQPVFRPAPGSRANPGSR